MGPFPTLTVAPQYLYYFCVVLLAVSPWLAFNQISHMAKQRSRKLGPAGGLLGWRVRTSDTRSLCSVV